MTYYEELDITQDATSVEIKKAYRRLMVAFHPDNYHGDQDYALDKSARLQEAYEVLSDPERRRAYDSELMLNGDGDFEEDIEYYNAEDYCDEDEFWNEWSEPKASSRKREKGKTGKEDARGLKRYETRYKEERRSKRRSKREERLRIFYMTIVTTVIVAAAMIGIFMFGQYTGQASAEVSTLAENAPQYVLVHTMGHLMR